MKLSKSKCVIAAAALCLMLNATALGALSFYVEPNNPWPAGWYGAAVANMQTVVNEYNAYGDFGSGSIYVYYNAGIPTAQSGYGGYGSSIGVGGTYPNVRVLLHESSHWLGTGTYSSNWTGPNASALIQQFEGVGAVLNGDSQHYWPYGENYDNESSPIDDARHVAMVYALRKDFGIGSTARPSAATSVTLTASDASGTSGFNYPWGWSDGHFPQPGTAYSTGDFLLRTPASANSFTFAGDSLRINNTNGSSGGLRLKGTGTTGVTTFKNLILDGGYVIHASGAADQIRLAGKVTLASSPTIDAAQGPLTISANIGGSGSLTKTGSFPLTLTGGNTYGGSTTIGAGILRLAPTTAVASYTFDSVSGSAVINSGTGGAAMNGTLANGATIVAGGKFGNAVSLANGASVNINNPIVDLGANTGWTVSAWVKTSTAGGSILTKGDGAGWSYGNTIFYLGDGTAGGSGGIPSAVRWAGGFFQGAAGSAAVNNNAWHQIIYVNEAGTYAIYVDGVAQSLSAGNSSFSVPDIGAVVRLGVSTNTVPADGAVNFNGLLDSVQFYNQGLSATQVSALYQGLSVGPLPITTDVSIASGATLDVNGLIQQIRSLTGPAGSAVTLGAGQLIVNSTTSTQFAGTISGTGGSLTKAGAGTLTLAGNNTYTGTTTLNAGTLRVTGSVAASSKFIVSGGTFEAAGAIQTLKSAVTSTGGTLRIAPATGGPARQLTIGDGSHSFADAASSAISITGGKVDVSSNALVVRYAHGSDAPAAAAIREYIASARGPAADWQGSGITSDAAIADPNNRAVGYALSSELLGPSGGTFMGAAVDGSSVLVRATLAGDATLDGQVDFADLVHLAQHYNTSGEGVDWLDGDFNYDGTVDFNDLVKLAQNYNGSLPANSIADASAGFDHDAALASASVPEPSISVLIAACGLAAQRRSARRRARR